MAHKRQIKFISSWKIYAKINMCVCVRLHRDVDIKKCAMVVKSPWKYAKGLLHLNKTNKLKAHKFLEICFEICKNIYTCIFANFGKAR